jgi:hypothetical protein
MRNESWRVSGICNRTFYDLNDLEKNETKFLKRTEREWSDFEILKAVTSVMFKWFKQQKSKNVPMIGLLSLLISVLFEF